MFFNSNKGTVKIDSTEMDYITFGKGEKPFIILPGVGEGLKPVQKIIIMSRIKYKLFAGKYKVYVFGRRDDMEEGYSTRDMAKDQKNAMEKLGIKDAHIMGISQGGMIAQYLAIDSPEMVDKLVLVVSISKQNKTIEKAIKNWIKLAEKKDYKNLVIDALEKSYTEAKLEKYRKAYPIITRFGKPESFEKFIVQANACLSHNAYDELDKIKSPTLIIAGGSDNVAGGTASDEIAERIKNSEYILYKELGHATFEEATEFNEEVLSFLQR